MSLTGPAAASTPAAAPGAFPFAIARLVVAVLTDLVRLAIAVVRLLILLDWFGW